MNVGFLQTQTQTRLWPVLGQCPYLYILYIYFDPPAWIMFIYHSSNPGHAADPYGSFNAPSLPLPLLLHQVHPHPGKQAVLWGGTCSAVKKEKKKERKWKCAVGEWGEHHKMMVWHRSPTSFCPTTHLHRYSHTHTYSMCVVDKSC